MPFPSPTRGAGLLEGMLAERRIRMALRLLPKGVDDILDIGCGLPPAFLLRCGARERHGIDQRVTRGAAEQDCVLHHHDCNTPAPLPFPSGQFDVVTMLAVLEHLASERRMPLLRDMRRILRPGGLLILTTPARRIGPLLRMMAHLGLVSRIEIAEHRNLLTSDGLQALLTDAGFLPQHVRTGAFEWGCNLWATAQRQGTSA